MNRIGVMQIVDTLAIGGLERLAVNVANSLPREHYRSYLCATRSEGQLGPSVNPHVKRLSLQRTGRFDFAALRRLIRYIDENKVRILHAHGTSVFIAAAAAVLKPRVSVLWHDHFGRAESEERSVLLYGSAAKAVRGVVTVTENLADWSRRKLRVPANKVWYVPNFVAEPPPHESIPHLPGTPGSRIVCVANLRPQKDHWNLLRAMKLVIQKFPEAHLILLGHGGDKTHLEKIKSQITHENLDPHVTWLGPRLDVSAILKGCDIGVLSSASEGLPLALIEYGMAGLPAISTSVGQCSEVLHEGRAGILVPPCLPTALADAIVSLLKSPEQRVVLKQEFSSHVRKNYSADAVVTKICRAYDAILN